jgi:hypothetical protein
MSAFPTPGPLADGPWHLILETRDTRHESETLDLWARAAGASRSRGRRAETPTEPPTPLEAWNAALRQKVRELEEEREIPRKATKYFAGESTCRPKGQPITAPDHDWSNSCSRSNRANGS